MYPILEQLIKSGDIFLDEDEYVGIASNGDEVSLGYVGQELRIEYYLQSHPTSNTW